MNKIPFDISFKERIERGEVKVVTRDNREVTIIKWDLKGNYPIVACFKIEVCNYEGDKSWLEERPFAFSKEGKRSNGFPEDKSDLFILAQEPVSEDMWEVSKQYALRQVLASTDAEMSEQDYLGLRLFSGFELAVAHKDGAQWQKQQMEAYRIEHCKSLTNEQAELEENFVSSHVEKNNRIPTFIDAIEYGMEYCKQQMMKEAVDVTIAIPYQNGYGGYTQLLDSKEGLPFGDKLKVLVIKEE